jgi:glycosyltransferase involved in cell wall biosynthesis
MAAGLGVVTTNHVGPESLIGGAGLGNLFDDGDAAGPEALLLRLAQDEPFRNEFRAAHRQYAERFHMRDVAEEWLTALSK